jgi:hypothetical protein
MRFWQPSRLVLQKLTALSALRHRLIGVRRQLEQPLAEHQSFGEPVLDKQLTKTCRTSITSIKADFETVEKQIQVVIDQDYRLKQLFNWIPPSQA